MKKKIFENERRRLFKYLNSLGVPWGVLGSSFQPLRGPLGSLGSLGDPWGCLAAPWGAQGNFLRSVENWTPNSEQMCLMYRAGA